MNLLDVTEDPRWLTEPVLLAIHARQIERFGGAHGIRDRNLLSSALERPRNRLAYRTKSDFADLAAAYLVGLVRNHGFVDGDKRTGLAASLVFLGLNGLALHVAPAELHALVMRVATNQLDDDAAARYLRDRVSARG